MSQLRQCAQCGAELPPAAPLGLCPACLLRHGLETHTGSGVNPFESPSQVPPSPEELAARFPDLEILELIGQGGMGVVYKARQKRLDRLVALKILSPKVSRDPAFAQRFVREAKTLARLNHPHIVAVYDFGQSDDLFYLLMEYVEGVNLHQLMAEQKLSPKEALAIVPQICEALQYAHDMGVVHRDIKPGNILLDTAGHVKIADFGVAKLTGVTPVDVTLTASGVVMGTVHYMAPEQTEHPQQVDHRADIYSLGVVFYQLLTGELPLGRFAPPSQKAQIDVRLDEVVLKTLEKEPQRRYQHARDVKTDVETIATALTPQQKPTRPAWHRLVVVVGTRKGKPVVNWAGVVFDFPAMILCGLIGILIAYFIRGSWNLNFWIALLAVVLIPTMFISGALYLGLSGRLRPERLVPLDDLPEAVTPRNQSRPFSFCVCRHDVRHSWLYHLSRLHHSSRLRRLAKHSTH